MSEDEGFLSKASRFYYKEVENGYLDYLKAKEEERKKGSKGGNQTDEKKWLSSEDIIIKENIMQLRTTFLEYILVED